jgi:hypothetical protein
MFSFFYRIYAFISGPETPKTGEPLRFGVLGASAIAYVDLNEPQNPVA